MACRIPTEADSGGMGLGCRQLDASLLQEELDMLVHRQLMHCQKSSTGELSIDLLGNRIPLDLVVWSIAIMRDDW
jgi:hypothetical protein